MALSRRSFLARLGWVLASITGLASAVTAGLYTVFPALKPTTATEGWQQLGEVDALPPEQPVKMAIELKVRDGWAETTSKQAVWVVRRSSGLDVFSAVCPHEGCSVDHDAKGFVCRCHASYWKEDGGRTTGPSPRDLDRLDYRVVDNRLEVKYQNFKHNVSEKIPV